MSSETPRYQKVAAAASLAIGPLLMSIGDLLHPEEDMDAAKQAAIIVEHASRWYAAHLLLFIGLILLVPGILALTGLTAKRNPTAGYVARVLVLMGVGVFCAVFASEMLIGRYVSDGADLSAVTELLETFQSGAILGVIMVGALAFFGGIAVFTVPLVIAGGQLRWISLVYMIGALLILAEIISSQVLLSQIGNVVLLGASVAFAWHIVRSDPAATNP